MKIELPRRRLFWLAEQPGIQKMELGLSAADADKLKAFGAEVRTAAREALGASPDFAKLSAEERKQAIETIEKADQSVIDKFLPKLKDILSADQLTRLKQINWQQAYVLNDSEIAESLSLTTEQKKTLEDIVAAHEASLDKHFSSVDIDTMFGTIIPVGNSPEEIKQSFEQFQAKINKVLTKEQQDKLSKIKGKEFDFQLLNP